MHNYVEVISRCIWTEKQRQIWTTSFYERNSDSRNATMIEISHASPMTETCQGNLIDCQCALVKVTGWRINRTEDTRDAAETEGLQWFTIRASSFSEPMSNFRERDLSRLSLVPEEISLSNCQKPIFDARLYL